MVCVSELCVSLESKPSGIAGPSEQLFWFLAFWGMRLEGRFVVFQQPHVQLMVLVHQLPVGAPQLLILCEWRGWGE